MSDSMTDAIESKVRCALKEGHHPECNLARRDVFGLPCNCWKARRQRMTETEKAADLQATRKEYLRTHQGHPAQVEADSWVAVYRKAISLAQQ